MSIRAAIYSDKTVSKSQRCAAWIPREQEKQGQDICLIVMGPASARH